MRHGREEWRVIRYRGRESEDGRHEKPSVSRRATCRAGGHVTLWTRSVQPDDVVVEDDRAPSCATKWDALKTSTKIQRHNLNFCENKET